MGEHVGPLVEAEYLKTLEVKLYPYFENLKCPICATSIWSVDSNIYDAPTHGSLGQILEVQQIKVMPYIVVTCNKCSYMHHFNAKRLGLTDLPRVTVHKWGSND